MKRILVALVLALGMFSIVAGVSGCGSSSSGAKSTKT
jgi:hypothetical protein